MKKVAIFFMVVVVVVLLANASREAGQGKYVREGHHSPESYDYQYEYGSPELYSESYDYQYEYGSSEPYSESYEYYSDYYGDWIVVPVEEVID